MPPTLVKVLELILAKRRANLSLSDFSPKRSLKNVLLGTISSGLPLTHPLVGEFVSKVQSATFPLLQSFLTDDIFYANSTPICLELAYDLSYLICFNPLMRGLELFTQRTG